MPLTTAKMLSPESDSGMPTMTVTVELSDQEMAETLELTGERNK